MSRISSSGQQGFTLVETLIATGLAGVVVLGAAEGMALFSKGQSQLFSKSTTDSNVKAFSQNLSLAIESAYIANQYQHLPIDLQCATPAAGQSAYATPCVRELLPDGTFSTTTPTAATITSPTPKQIEFY